MSPDAVARLLILIFVVTIFAIVFWKLWRSGSLSGGGSRDGSSGGSSGAPSGQPGDPGGHHGGHGGGGHGGGHGGGGHGGGGGATGAAAAATAADETLPPRTRARVSQPARCSEGSFRPSMPPRLLAGLPILAIDMAGD